MPTGTKNVRCCPLSVQLTSMTADNARGEAHGHPHWLLAVPIPFSRSDDEAHFLAEGGARALSKTAATGTLTAPDTGPTSLPECDLAASPASTSVAFATEAGSYISTSAHAVKTARGRQARTLLASAGLLSLAGLRARVTIVDLARGASRPGALTPAVRSAERIAACSRERPGDRPSAWHCEAPLQTRRRSRS